MNITYKCFIIYHFFSFSIIGWNHHDARLLMVFCWHFYGVRSSAPPPLSFRCSFRRSTLSVKKPPYKIHPWSQGVSSLHHYHRAKPSKRPGFEGETFVVIILRNALQTCYFRVCWNDDSCVKKNKKQTQYRRSFYRRHDFQIFWRVFFSKMRDLYFWKAMKLSIFFKLWNTSLYAVSIVVS